MLQEFKQYQIANISKAEKNKSLLFLFIPFIFHIFAANINLKL